MNLPPGTHTYQFSYQIPGGVPSSFSGERGGIKYYAKATIELRDQRQTVLNDEIAFKARFQNHVLEKFFEVVAPFDLNLGSPKLKVNTSISKKRLYDGQIPFYHLVTTFFFHIL